VACFFTPTLSDTNNGEDTDAQEIGRFSPSRKSIIVDESDKNNHEKKTPPNFLRWRQHNLERHGGYSWRSIQHNVIYKPNNEKCRKKKIDGSGNNADGKIRGMLAVAIRES